LLIVSGLAVFIFGEEIKFLKDNDSIYKPFGVKHRLSSLGEISFILIEVQS